MKDNLSERFGRWALKKAFPLVFSHVVTWNASLYPDIP
jgi:hypothetical protein